MVQNYCLPRKTVIFCAYVSRFCRSASQVGDKITKCKHTLQAEMFATVTSASEISFGDVLVVYITAMAEKRRRQRLDARGGCSKALYGATSSRSRFITAKTCFHLQSAQDLTD